MIVTSVAAGLVRTNEECLLKPRVRVHACVGPSRLVGVFLARSPEKRV